MSLPGPGWLRQPVGRLAALVLGTYPAAPVPGVDRWVPPGTFTSVKEAVPTRVTLDHPEFPGASFYRGFQLKVLRSGYAERQSGINPRAGVSLRRAVVELAIGYPFGEEAQMVPAAAGLVTIEDASVQGHEDHEQIEQVLIYPNNRGGDVPAIYAIRRVADVDERRVPGLDRLVIATAYEVGVAYVPGTTGWP